MLKKFSVSYIIEKNKKKKIELNKKTGKNKSNVLNEDTAEYMLSLGN